MELPDTYVPEELRESEIKELPIKYGIGIEHNPHEFGMLNGPVDTILEMLNTVPSYKDIVPSGLRQKIYLLELPTDRKLYRWYDSMWVKVIE